MINTIDGSNFVLLMNERLSIWQLHGSDLCLLDSLLQLLSYVPQKLFPRLFPK